MTEPASRRQTWWSWLRLVLVLAVGLGLALPTLFFVAWYLFAGGRFGWVTSLLAFGLLGAATGRLAVTKRWELARRSTTIGLAVLLGLGGIAAAHWAPATEGRLRHAIKAFEEPGWQLTREHIDGNAACWDACLSVSRTYHVDASVDDVLARLRPVLARRGLRPGRASRAGSFVFDQSGVHDVDVTVSIEPGTRGAALVFISADARG